MSLCLLIPARGGSVRVPRKNMAVVGGTTLVRRAICVAQQVAGSSTVPTVVAVSTDDDEIASDVASSALAQVWRRVLSAGDRPISAVLDEHAADGAISADDTVVLLEPTCPQRSQADVLSAIVMAERHGLPVCCVHDAGNHGWARNGAAWVWPPQSRDWSRTTSPWLVHDTGTLIDINTPEDLARARAAMA